MRRLKVKELPQIAGGWIFSDQLTKRIDFIDFVTDDLLADAPAYMRNQVFDMPVALIDYCADLHAKVHSNSAAIFKALASVGQLSAGFAMGVLATAYAIG
jgi:2-hydroxy-3-keto-5-methylthiopentenyl-1-phosphate phosphatase